MKAKAGVVENLNTILSASWWRSINRSCTRRSVNIGASHGCTTQLTRAVSLMMMVTDRFVGYVLYLEAVPLLDCGSRPASEIVREPRIACSSFFIVDYGSALS